MSSVPFDRIAEDYDRTRAMPEGATTLLVERLVAAIRDRRCLEIGVGTGRVALPLAAAGVRLVGLDLSRRMLERLVDNAGGERPFPIVEGDAGVLPFRDDAFGAALAVHVFHLLPAWRDVVAELARVIEPGGVVIASRPRQGAAIRAVQRRFLDELALERMFPGVTDADDLDGAFVAHGAEPRDLEPIDVSRTTTLERVIAVIEEQRWSWTWQVDEEAIRAAASRVRAWAAETLAPLDAPFETEMALVLRAYDL